MPRDPEQVAHQEWLGYVQPVGLVVSIPALLAALAHINRNIIPDHQRFLDCLPRDAHDELIPELRDFPEFTEQVLGWRVGDLEVVPPGDARYASIEVPLPEYGETLRPTHVVRELEPKDPQHPWMMLIQLLPTGTELDDAPESKDRTWHAPPQARFERLLRESRVPIGVLCNATQIRLVYAPRGETSGFATFSVSEMAQVAGRPIFAALHMLLCEERLFSLGEKQRLPAILADSRKYQNVVSTQLAEQVLAALYELVRGFQAADDQAKGELLREVLAENPNHVYQGLLTVLMRLVFVLYAEDRGLLSSDPIFANYYSLTGLFERLREDDGRNPDTMDQRYGAWAQFLTLFRLIYEGGSHGEFRIPPRHGYLFDPDRYNFLEGRPWKTPRQHHDGDVRVPRVSDGVIFRVLNNLLILDGERLSYRTLDVEQIGSVYEAVMGMDLHVAEGRSIALRLPRKNKGTRPPVTINLQELLAKSEKERKKALIDLAEWEVSGRVESALKVAKSIEDLAAVMEPRIHRAATPFIVPKGAMVLQPSDERRRSGSHYTPRILTEPIVETTFRPILERLGPNPTPAQILDLKICDPAMGSGAFLVAVCRFLAELLVKAWHYYKCVPVIPPDEDEILHARRIVAQRCLYGVDKNPMAADLAKLSLWLATLAKDHPFTFLDHALRCGDSLVGLSKKQIEGFHWKPEQQRDFARGIIEGKIRRAIEGRLKIQNASEFEPYLKLDQELALVEEALDRPRFYGDLVVSAFFAGSNDRKRKDRLDELADTLAAHLANPDFLKAYPALISARDALRSGQKPVTPFHWEIEFPEAFARENPGFDAIVGNPPFAGKNTLIAGHREGYLDWLKAIHEESHGNADLVAHFFRRAFNLLQSRGCFGLIATNSIGQGDTRSTGLRWICNHGGTIYWARKRYKWPGQAAVIVSVVHLCRGALPTPFVLDGHDVQIITAYLFHAGGHDSPARLQANALKSFIGTYLLGMGFTFDDSDHNDAANPIWLMHELIERDPRNGDRISPYIGGDEINDSPSHSHHRYVINFGDMSEDDARRWPLLLQVVEAKVKPERLKQKDKFGKEHWWQFMRTRPELRSALLGRQRALVVSRVTQYFGFVFLPATMVFSERLVVFPVRRVSGVRRDAVPSS